MRRGRDETGERREREERYKGEISFFFVPELINSGFFNFTAS
jgi:hypothetical protein